MQSHHYSTDERNLRLVAIPHYILGAQLFLHATGILAVLIIESEGGAIHYLMLTLFAAIGLSEIVAHTGFGDSPRGPQN